MTPACSTVTRQAGPSHSSMLQTSTYQNSRRFKFKSSWHDTVSAGKGSDTAEGLVASTFVVYAVELFGLQILKIEPETNWKLYYVPTDTASYPKTRYSSNCYHNYRHACHRSDKKPRKYSPKLVLTHRTIEGTTNDWRSPCNTFYVVSREITQTTHDCGSNQTADGCASPTYRPSLLISSHLTR